jgi:hypothetical protein
MQLSYSFIIQTANISVWLSAAAYCGKDNYSTMKLSGPASGFLVKESLHDVKSDLQGYIGILPNLQKIFVVFRGSSSTRNWIEDFEIKKTEYTTYPYCNCKVHDGFYSSAKEVSNRTVEIVKLLHYKYKYDIIITGHSYGAAVSQLISLELLYNNIENEVYNFGQPRIGDNNFANFVNTQQKNIWRITHNKDIVPHLPPIKGFEFMHSCREVFEDETGNIKVCSENNCEDDSCSMQYKLKDTNTADHSIYLGHNMNCESSVNI